MPFKRRKSVSRAPKGRKAQQANQDVQRRLAEDKEFGLLLPVNAFTGKSSKCSSTYLSL